MNQVCWFPKTHHGTFHWNQCGFTANEMSTCSGCKVCLVGTLGAEGPQVMTFECLQCLPSPSLCCTFSFPSRLPFHLHRGASTTQLQEKKTQEEVLIQSRPKRWHRKQLWEAGPIRYWWWRWEDELWEWKRQHQQDQWVRKERKGRD